MQCLSQRMPPHPPALCRLLVEACAPNTEPLRDPLTGKMKKLCPVLMADSWEPNPLAKETCVQKLLELGITPALPRGDTHAVGDSCTPWPTGPSRGTTNAGARTSPAAGNAASANGGFFYRPFVSRGCKLLPPRRVMCVPCRATSILARKAGVCIRHAAAAGP